MKILRLISNGLARVEAVLLAISLLTMLFVAFYQVLIRNLYDFAYVWADELVRILVLWVGLLGAALATHEGHHLSIDVVTKFLSPRLSLLVKVLARIFALVICIVLAQAAYGYILFEREGGQRALFALPIWTTELIIPVAFILISFHFGVLIIQGVGELLFGVKPPEAPGGTP